MMGGRVDGRTGFGAFTAASRGLDNLSLAAVLMMAILVRSQLLKVIHTLYCVCQCVQYLFDTGCYLTETHINLKLEELNQTRFSMTHL